MEKPHGFNGHINASIKANCGHYPVLLMVVWWEFLCGKLPPLLLIISLASVHNEFAPAGAALLLLGLPIMQHAEKLPSIAVLLQT